MGQKIQERMEMLLIRLFNCRNNENLEELIIALGRVKKFFKDKIYYLVFEEILQIMRDNGDLRDNFESILKFIHRYALDFATEELIVGESAFISWDDELEYNKSIYFDLEYEFEVGDFDFLELNPKKTKEMAKKFNDFLHK